MYFGVSVEPLDPPDGGEGRRRRDAGRQGSGQTGDSSNPEKRRDCTRMLRRVGEGGSGSPQGTAANWQGNRPRPAGSPGESSPRQPRSNVRLQPPRAIFMRIFHCDHCGRPVFFENTFCGNCGHKLAYLPDLKIVASLDPVERSGRTGSDRRRGAASSGPRPSRGRAGRTYRLCQNYTKYNVCNWAVPAEDPNPLCPSCRLTRVIPDLSVAGNENAWRRLEAAKRRLVYSLMEFGLPLRNKLEDPRARPGVPVHGRPARRPPRPDRPRQRRHHRQHRRGRRRGAGAAPRLHARAVPHPARPLPPRDRPLLLGPARSRTRRGIDDYRKRFGDERADYNQSLQAHYANGPRPDWPKQFVSAYASVHPWEDWAETWAHYLHMTDTLETAATLRPVAPARPARRAGDGEAAEQAGAAASRSTRSSTTGSR